MMRRQIGDATPSRRMYSVLLRCYPRSMREQFGEQMYHLFVDTWREGRRDGKRLLGLRMWIRAAYDALYNGVASRLGGRGTVVGKEGARSADSTDVFPFPSCRSNQTSI